MDQEILQNNEQEKIPYETPELRPLGQLSQLIQGCSDGEVQDHFPENGVWGGNPAYKKTCG